MATAHAEPNPLYNPKPLPDDVSLPLPCEGEMVFRYVYVLAKGTLDDREVSLGYPFSEGETGYQQSFISGYRRDFINGQFTLSDLSKDWQSSFPAACRSRRRARRSSRCCTSSASTK